MNDVDLAKLRKIYRLLYQQPTMRRVVDVESGKVYSKVLNDLTCRLDKMNNEGHYNVYVEKYYDKTRIKTIILDYDGENARKDIYSASNLLSLHNIMHLIINSTNKGYHLYILLPKPLNFQLSKSRRFNNKVFTNFIINLVGDCETLDKSNYGLFSNIRQIGSVHPKTGEVLRVEYAFAPFVTEEIKIRPYYYMENNDYFYNAFVKSIDFIKYENKMNSIISAKFKATKYTNGVVDLRDLFDGVSYDGGKSKWCKCHWHDDEKPSLRVYEKVAYCTVCGMIPFKDIKEEFNI